jgi:membrane-bound serine protease (ClpP class)
MKKLSFIISLLLFVPLLLNGQTVLSLKVDDAITQATADFIERGINKAGNENAVCLVIQLNTPGGLLTATRDIVGTILDAPVPVIVYVSPSGARAASAGVFITLSANIAAMAPGTNIGAAHPVNLQGGMDSVMSEKVTNDAAAFIRTIAEKRQRNLQWAENAVRNSISITENEALDKNVINLIAPNIRSLLQQVNGKQVTTSTGTVILDTKDASVETMEMGFSEKLVSMLSNPNIMYILLLLGIFGILFEFFNPGAILPGVIGVICLILSFYSMSVLPINYAGLALIIFAIILFILEVKIVSHGLLAIGGIICLFLGSIMLIQTPSGLSYMKISLSVIIPAVIITAAFFLFIIGFGLKAQKAKVTTGEKAFIGKTGITLNTLDPIGTIRIYGEIWKAESVAGTIKEGQKVRVTEVEGLKVFVEPAEGS